MPISSDLFLAILAMDSYNRRYDQGINLDESVKRLGNAEIEDDSSILGRTGGQLNDVAASFFAQSYSLTGAYQSYSGGAALGVGQTVISYRGTHDRSADAVSGWPMGGGLYSVSQGNLAIDFYKNVRDAGAVDEAKNVMFAVNGDGDLRIAA
jgi:hypothetical protein